MNRTQIQVGIGAVSLALIALLYYSLERTAWLFALFEKDTDRAWAAAVVVELAAVALLAGASVLDEKSRPWANRALLAILSVQALGNLSAGYLKGGMATLQAFGAGWAAFAVAATLWLVANLAVPGLVLCLSKLLEQMLSQYAKLPAAQKEEKKHTPALKPVLAHSKPEQTVSASVVVADGVCKYCQAPGLSAIEKARHGRARARTGVCPQ